MGNQVTYISPEAPNFKTRLVVEGVDKVYDKHLEFKNKHLVLDDEKDAEVIRAFDEVIAKNPAISQLVKKVDIDAAEKLAREHRAKALRENAGQSGSATTANDPARLMKMEEERNRLLSQGMSDEEASTAVAEMFGEKTVIVETKDNPVINPNPGEPVETETEADKRSDPKDVFANLASKKT